MWDFIWFLLPVAAASGWWVGARGQTKHSSGGAKGLHQDYFRGLNYVLHDKPDKAIEVFIKMVEVDSETVETHSALGNLFRRRGEVDRAIRIHQNLIARPNLTREQRAEALLELGEDYMRAGLFDRAENLFLELIDMKLHTEAALDSLIAIYEQEKDWSKAIDMATRQSKLSGLPMNKRIAQYYCELAEKGLKKGEAGLVSDSLKRAFRSDKSCVRASILRGDMEFDAGNFKSAISNFEKVAEQDMEFLSEVMGRLRDSYEQSGNGEKFMDYLKGLMNRCNGVAPMLALAQQIQVHAGIDKAMEFVTSCLRAKPSVPGLKRLVELKLAITEGRPREDLLILQELITSMLDDKQNYRCESCGFSGKSMHWHCPSCKSWNTIKPIQGFVKT